MSQLFASNGQSFGTSVSVLPMNIEKILISFKIDCFDLLQSKGISGVFSLKELKASILFVVQPSLRSNYHIHTWRGKTMALTIQTFAGKVMSLLFNTLSRFVIAFLPRRKCLLLSWLQSPSVVILEPKKIKSVTVSIFPPSIYHEVMEPNAMILVFWMLSFRSAFHSLLSPSSRGSLVPLHFLPLGWCHLHIWGDWYFSWQSWFQVALHPAWLFSWYPLHRS